MHFLDSDLMLNQDGSTYHLHAFPGDIAQKVIFVGEGTRALEIAKRFDRIELERQYRGFIVKTGYLRGERITVINTAIGCGNIDIVMNELDALVNIDFNTKAAKKSLTRLCIIRLGTAGTLQKDIEPGSLVLASHALATDGLMSYYDAPATTAPELMNALAVHLHEPMPSRNLYLGSADSALQRAFSAIAQPGLSCTAIGFYGPQYRQLRLPASQRMRLDHLQAFHHGDHRIAKLEMETAAIYALGQSLGHACCSLSTIVVNRITGARVSHAKTSIDHMIDQALAIIVDL